MALLVLHKIFKAKTKNNKLAIWNSEMQQM